MSVWQDVIRKLAGKRPEDVGDLKGVYVRGSGLVWIPSARVSEVASIVRERHRREAELALLAAMVARR